MSRLLALVLVAISIGPAATAVAAPRAELRDREDEVMCGGCGTPLPLSEAPAADRERAFIQRRIDEGMTKTQIKRALAWEYGEEVLAMPAGRGFSLAAYLVPIAVMLGVLAALLAALRRRRGATEAPAEPLGGTFEDQVDADLAGVDPRPSSTTAA